MWIYHICLSSYQIDGHLGCFHVLAILNNGKIVTILSTFVYKFWVNMRSSLCFLRAPSLADVGAKTETYVITCADRMAQEKDGQHSVMVRTTDSAITN